MKVLEESNNNRDKFEAEIVKKKVQTAVDTVVYQKVFRPMTIEARILLLKLEVVQSLLPLYREEIEYSLINGSNELFNKLIENEFSTEVNINRKPYKLD